MPGPLSDEALGVFASCLSELAGRRMVLDPDACGHEVYDEHRARYQFKVEGGRSSDDQGIVLRATGDPEVWVVRHNLVWASYHIRDNYWQASARPRLTLEERVLGDIESVLPHSFAAVVAEFMAPYEEPI